MTSRARTACPSSGGGEVPRYGTAGCAHCTSLAVVYVTAGTVASDNYRCGLACQRHRARLTRWASTAGTPSVVALAGAPTAPTQLALFDTSTMEGRQPWR